MRSRLPDTVIRIDEHGPCTAELKWRQSLDFTATQRAAWRRCHNGLWMLRQLWRGLNGGELRTISPSLICALNTIIDDLGSLADKPALDGACWRLKAAIRRVEKAEKACSTADTLWVWRALFFSGPKAKMLIMSAAEKRDLAMRKEIDATYLMMYFAEEMMEQVEDQRSLARKIRQQIPKWTWSV